MVVLGHYIGTFRKGKMKFLEGKADKENFTLIGLGPSILSPINGWTEN